MLGPLFGKSFNEKNVQIIGRISAILFVIWQDFVNVWQNTPYTIWSLQARNQFGTPGGAKNFLRGVQYFWTMSNSFKWCPTHFSRGGKKFSRGSKPPLLSPWLRAWVTLLGLAYRIGVVEQRCQIVKYYTIFVKWCNFSTSCRKNFVPHHREIGTIWCIFKRINTILNSQI